MYLRHAFEAGVRAAGYDLASLPAHLDQGLAGLPDEERVALLEEQALSGEVTAGLTLFYEFAGRISKDRLIAVLEAIAPYSTEASDWLKEISIDAV